MIKEFHYRDGLFFRRNEDNSVTIGKLDNSKDENVFNVIATIDENGWASIISSVSVMGEDFGRFYDALDWHNGIDYKKICEYYGVDLRKIKIGDKYCEANGEDTYINSSYFAGGKDPEIFLGIYDDKELEKISFFHELGHFLENLDRSNCSTYDIEAEAWRVGFEVAKGFQITFTDNALKWANDQLETYRHYEGEESTKQYRILPSYGLVVDKSAASESFPIKTKEYPDEFYKL